MDGRTEPMTSVNKFPDSVITGKRLAGDLFSVPNQSNCTSRDGADLIGSAAPYQSKGSIKSTNGFSSLESRRYYAKRLLLILLANPIAELTALGSQC
jgi:hypothetical protein